MTLCRCPAYLIPHYPRRDCVAGDRPLATMSTLLSRCALVLDDTGGVVGLSRKIASISTAGLVNYRNDGERTAKYTRQTRNATRLAAIQNGKMLNNQERQITQAQVHFVEEQVAAMPPGAPPPGWYPNPADGTSPWWWDGVQWVPPPEVVEQAEEPPALPTGSAGGDVYTQLQLQRLGELREAGVLTDEEFAAKKAELLGRL